MSRAARENNTKSEDLKAAEKTASPTHTTGGRKWFQTNKGIVGGWVGGDFSNDVLWKTRFLPLPDSIRHKVAFICSLTTQAPFFKVTRYWGSQKMKQTFYCVDVSVYVCKVETDPRIGCWVKSPTVATALQTNALPKWGSVCLFSLKRPKSISLHGGPLQFIRQRAINCYCWTRV